MSSNTASKQAIPVCKLAVCLAFLLSAPVQAQDDTAETNADTQAPEAEAPPEPDEPFRIDLTVTVPRGDVNQAQAQQCEDEADAASISGDIIVCRQLGEDGSNYYSGSRTDAQRRYAAETAFEGDPQAPDVAGAGIFKGPATVGGLCLIPPCPPEAALIIDVEALPKAPEGSDADRIARGLPPLGDRELTEEEEKARREALDSPN